jgi:hypothetical protein
MTDNSAAVSVPNAPDAKPAPTASDATRFIVLHFGNGNGVETGFTVKGAFDNEPAARKAAEELALANMGERFGVYTKFGTAVGKTVAEWKGVS